jgi:spore coat protein JB
MTKREALMKKIATYQFAAHDLQLFLDTHPGDTAAMEQMQRYEAMAAPLVEQYEKQYGALTKRREDGNNWDWIKAPWPWESEEDC